MDHRADRMKSLIIRTFFDCMEKEDFSQITIGKISGIDQPFYLLPLFL